MRKATTLLLAAVMMAAGSQVAKAADRSGLGVTWSIGPTIQLGDFDMKFDQELGVSWAVGENFGIEIFKSDGQLRGEHTYTDDVTVPGSNIDQHLVVSGNVNQEGLRFLAGIPFLSFVKFRVGAELGVSDVSITQVTQFRSDGGATTGTEFGVLPTTGTINAPLIGILAKASLLSAESKTVATSLDVMASLRFVNFADTNMLGSQESNTTKTPLAGIDPYSSYNTLAIRAGLNVSF